MVTKAALTHDVSGAEPACRAAQTIPAVQRPPGDATNSQVVRRLTSGDAARMSELAQAYGWRRDAGVMTLLLESGNAWGVDTATGLVAVGASLRTDDAATISKILVEPTQTGQGLGARVLGRLLDQSDVEFFHLNATDAGVPTYARQGFTPVGQIVMYKGPAAAFRPTPGGMGVRCETARPCDLRAVEELDRAATGLDRAALLGHIYGTAEQIAVAHTDAGRPCGYAARWFNEVDDAVGPIVAENADVASALVTHLAGGVRVGETRRGGGTCSGVVRVDAITSADATLGADTPAAAAQQEAFVQWLRGLGLTDLGVLTRMARGVPPQVADGIALFGVYAHATG